MNTSLKKVIGLILLCLVVLSTLLALLQWQQTSSVGQVGADIRRTMREQGFKTDLADFNLRTDAATEARMAKLAVFPNKIKLDDDDDELDLLPTATNDFASIVWKQSSLKIGTNDLRWSDLRTNLETYRRVLDVACDAALSGPILFDADASRFILSRNSFSDVFGLQPWFMENLSPMLVRRVVLELHDGHPDAVWTNLLAATRLVTAWQPQAGLPASSPRFIMTESAFNATWQVLQYRRWPEEKLARLQQEWESVTFFTNLPDETVSALTIALYDCEQESQKRPFAGFSFGNFVGQIMEEPADTFAEVKNQMAIGIYNTHGVVADKQGLPLYYQKRALELRRAMQATNWMEMRALPGVTNVPQFQSWSPALREIESYRQSWDNSLLPRLAFAEAQRRMLITVLALERYRGKHGAYPATLTPLAPEFLNTLPVDFMDGQPLRYRLTDDGHFVLYSVGLNGIDDGGKMPDATTPHLPEVYDKDPVVPTEADLVWPRPANP